MGIRLARAEDYNKIVRLLSLMQREVDDEIFASVLNDDTRALIVAELNGEIAGMISCNLILKLDRKECRIDRLVVHDEYRGQGIGSSLLQASEDWSIERQVKRIEFTSSAQRPEAHALYVKNGYHIRETSVFAKQLGEIKTI